MAETREIPVYMQLAPLFYDSPKRPRATHVGDDADSEDAGYRRLKRTAFNEQSRDVGSNTDGCRVAPIKCVGGVESSGMIGSSCAMSSFSNSNSNSSSSNNNSNNNSSNNNSVTISCISSSDYSSSKMFDHSSDMHGVSYRTQNGFDGSSDTRPKAPYSMSTSSSLSSFSSSYAYPHPSVATARTIEQAAESSGSIHSRLEQLPSYGEWIIPPRSQHTSKTMQASAEYSLPPLSASDFALPSFSVQLSIPPLSSAVTDNGTDARDWSPEAHDRRIRRQGKEPVSTSRRPSSTSSVCSSSSFSSNSSSVSSASSSLQMPLLKSTSSVSSMQTRRNGSKTNGATKSSTTATSTSASARSGPQNAAAGGGTGGGAGGGGAAPRTAVSKSRATRSQTGRNAKAAMNNTSNTDADGNVNGISISSIVTDAGCNTANNGGNSVDGNNITLDANFTNGKPSARISKARSASSAKATANRTSASGTLPSTNVAAINNSRPKATQLPATNGNGAGAVDGMSASSMQAWNLLLSSQLASSSASSLPSAASQSSAVTATTASKLPKSNVARPIPLKAAAAIATATNSYNIANNPYIHPAASSTTSAASTVRLLYSPLSCPTVQLIPQRESLQMQALAQSQRRQQQQQQTHDDLQNQSNMNHRLLSSGQILTDPQQQTLHLSQPIKSLQAQAPQQLQKQAQSASKSEYDDDDGHYIIRIGDELASRYKITKLLGQGTFGKVVQCDDNQRNLQVAVKIIRNIEKYREASKIEIRVLKALKYNDPRNEYGCIHLIDLFDFRNHVCMVFELLDISLFDFMKANDFRPFPLEQIQTLGQQLIRSVAFLHALSLIHTDLKPENILLVNSKYNVVGSGKDAMRVLRNSDIRLIDFGSATFDSEYHSSVVSTRHYRAPEIILGMGWSYPCDVWSIGCILLELFTGDAVFQTHDNLEHLAMMERVIGKIPVKLVNAASPSAKLYFRNGHLDWPKESCPRSNRKLVRDMKKVRDIVGDKNDELKGLFCDLLLGLLSYSPEQRLTAMEALNHPFFSYRQPVVK